MTVPIDVDLTDDELRESEAWLLAQPFYGDDFDPVDADIDFIGELRARIAEQDREINELRQRIMTGQIPGRYWL